MAAGKMRRRCYQAGFDMESIFEMLLKATFLVTAGTHRCVSPAY